MNNQLTEIAYILDRSGSMTSIAEAAITSFNDFLKEQQSGPGDAHLTLVLFDNEYLSPHQATPIADVPELNAQTYVPRGATALLDAVGITIKNTGARLSQIPEADRPGHVIIAIFTDGLENASSEFTLAEINKMITHQSDHYSWEFIFLAANQDAIATAAQMGIQSRSAVTIEYSRVGTTSAAGAMSKSVLKSREQNFFEGEVRLEEKATMTEEYDKAQDALL